MAQGLFFSLWCINYIYIYATIQPLKCGPEWLMGEQVKRQEVGSGDWQRGKLAVDDYWTISIAIWCFIIWKVKWTSVRLAYWHWGSESSVMDPQGVRVHCDWSLIWIWECQKHHSSYSHENWKYQRQCGEKYRGEEDVAAVTMTHSKCLDIKKIKSCPTGLFTFFLSG